MTTLRQFTMDDLLKFNNINLDILTETYNMSFVSSLARQLSFCHSRMNTQSFHLFFVVAQYMAYMSRWPESFAGR